MGKLWEMVWSRSLRITPAERCGSWGVYTPTSEDHWLMAAFFSTTWGQCSFWQLEMGVERACCTEMQTLAVGSQQEHPGRSTEHGQGSDCVRYTCYFWDSKFTQDHQFYLQHISWLYPFLYLLFAPWSYECYLPLVWIKTGLWFSYFNF